MARDGAESHLLPFRRIKARRYHFISLFSLARQDAFIGGFPDAPLVGFRERAVRMLSAPKGLHDWRLPVVLSDNHAWLAFHVTSQVMRPGGLTAFAGAAEKN